MRPACLFSLALLLLGCDLIEKQEPDVRPLHTKLVTDSTVFIVGVLETSPDTVHHYPEIFVGYLSDPLIEA